MSRYYNEDWQRRKAYLIRSLFQDIPYRVLSPVLEESTRSSQTQVPAESRQSSSTQRTDTSDSYEELSRSKSETITSTESSISLKRTEAPGPRITRPYSPLPPLIIEVEPNRHDEKEEYYITLLRKMRRIYRKMFLEGKSINDDDFYESLGEVSMDISCVNEENFSDNVNLESTRGDENLIGIDLNRESSSIEDGRSTTSDLDGAEESDDKMIETDSSASNEDPSYSQMTFKADIHMDSTPPSPVRPSPVYEEQRSEVQALPIVKFPSQGPQSLGPEAVSHDTNLSARSSTSGRNKIIGLRRSVPDEAQDLQDKGLSNRSISPKSPEEYLPARNIENSGSVAAETSALRPELQVSSIDEEESFESPILSSHSQFKIPKDVAVVPKRLLEGDQEMRTTEITHDDGLNKSKEDPVFVLRFNITTRDRSILAEKDLNILEENQDPDTTSHTEENDAHIKEIEVMRTPRPEVSRESIPTGPARDSSKENEDCERTAMIPRVSDVTTASEFEGDFCTEQRKRVDDIENVLEAIFNSPPDRRFQSYSNHDSVTSSKNSSCRKRRFEESSAQTTNVSWSDLRNNFFVGTPKILKLCSCVDHSCN